MPAIMVIDDDTLVRASICANLRSAEFTVLEAEDGRQALAELDRHSVDLVVCDIIMPELDGLGVIGALRLGRPDLQIIAISGGGRVSDLDYLPMAKKLGANTILYKPFTHKELLAAVVAILPKRAAAAPCDE